MKDWFLSFFVTLFEGSHGTCNHTELLAKLFVFSKPFSVQTGWVNNVVFTSCLESQVSIESPKRKKSWNDTNLCILGVSFAVTVCLLSFQNDQLSLIQKLVRACNPDSAFILAKGGEVTR